MAYKAARIIVFISQKVISNFARFDLGLIK